eukprot:7380871-Prymnesium_polylepis.4
MTLRTRCGELCHKASVSVCVTFVVRAPDRSVWCEPAVSLSRAVVEHFHLTHKFSAFAKALSSSLRLNAGELSLRRNSSSFSAFSKFTCVRKEWLVVSECAGSGGFCGSAQ